MWWVGKGSSAWATANLTAPLWHEEHHHMYIPTTPFNRQMKVLVGRQRRGVAYASGTYYAQQGAPVKQARRWAAAGVAWQNTTRIPSRQRI